MRSLTRIADKLVDRLAPKASAAADQPPICEWVSCGGGCIKNCCPGSGCTRCICP